MRNPHVSRELRRLVSRMAAPLAVVVLAACSSSSSSTTQPPATPSIDLSLSPAAVSVSQGQSGTAIATVNRTNFTGSITLSAEGLPTGVTASFNPPSLSNDATSSVLTLSAASTAAPTNLVPISARFVRSTARAGASNSSSSSSASVTIRASGAGVSDKTAALALTVAVAGGYTLSATPASLSVAQGSSGSSSINITRSGGFAGSVALGVAGAPTGMTATLSPTSTTSNSSSLSIAAASTTAPGVYALTVTGTSAGLTNQTTTVSVTVTALTSSSIQYCATDTPIWFGYQNDGASWVHLTPGANNTFTFGATPRVAIAAVTKTAFLSSSIYDLTVVYTTPAEIAALAAASCKLQSGTKQLTGSAAGLAYLDEGQIQMGPSSATVFGIGTDPFTLSNLPDGALDLLAARVPSSNQYTLVPNAMILRRGVNLTSGSTIPVLDFGSSEAFAPATATLSLTGLGSDVAFAVVSFTTGNGTAASMALLDSIGASSTIVGMPSAKLATGDIHQLVLSASPSGSEDRRGVIEFFHNLTATTVALKAALNAPTITVPHATPYAQPNVQVVSQSDYASGVLASFTQLESRSASVLVTAGYLGGVPATWNVTLPDLSAAPSFDSSWGLQVNTYTSWNVEAFGGPLNAVLASAAADGTTLTFASKTGSVTTPSSSRKAPVVVSASRAQQQKVSIPAKSWLRRMVVGVPISR